MLVYLDAFIDDIFDDRTFEYQEELIERKAEKGLNSTSRGNISIENEKSFEIEEDIYSIYLTQIEIQGHIKKVNKEVAIGNILNAFKHKNQTIFEQAVNELKLKDFKKVKHSFFFEKHICELFQF